MILSQESNMDSSIEIRKTHFKNKEETAKAHEVVYIQIRIEGRSYAR